MKVLLTGATGFVGRKLAKALAARGHELAAVSRRRGPASRVLPPGTIVHEWDWHRVSEFPHAALAGMNCVVHLAGEPLGSGRWTERRKTELRNSRVITTRQLRKSMDAVDPKRRTRLFCASAVGYYGDRREELLTESSPAGGDFLAALCRDWEAECRDVSLRFGMVLGRGEGALKRLLPVFKLGLGGKLGSGKQWVSWVHVDDLVELICFLLENPPEPGPVNCVSPGPVRNRELARALGRVLHRPAILRVPGFVLKAALGEQACVVLSSQRAQPERALALGFKFRFPDLNGALADILEPG